MTNKEFLARLRDDIADYAADLKLIAEGEVDDELSSRERAARSAEALYRWVERIDRLGLWE